MAAISFNFRINLQVGKGIHGVVVEEIEGLIKVYKDGHIERHLIIPNVPCTVLPVDSVAVKDVVNDKFNCLWASFYVLGCSGKLPLLVYFDGGGFCVGSAAWSCYHEFLATPAAKAGCIIMSSQIRIQEMMSHLSSFFNQ